jgi:hypothetical protein
LADAFVPDKLLGRGCGVRGLGHGATVMQC